MNWTAILVIIILIIVIISILSVPVKEKPINKKRRSLKNVRKIRSKFSVKSSNVVPVSDIIDRKYLEDFFSKLRTRVTSIKKNPVDKPCYDCKRDFCKPLYELDNVSFTEVPVIGAYGVTILAQKYSENTGGRDILFIHGVGSSFLSMRNIYMNSWLRLKHNVYSMQERGAGAGPYPDPFGPQGGYDLAVTWADDLNAVITTLGLTSGNVVLVGHSYGAVIVADYIRKYGQGMLAGLVLSNPLIEPISTAYGFSSFHPSFLSLTIDLLTNGWVPDSYGWKTFIKDLTLFNDQHRWTYCDMYPNQGIEWGADPASWRYSLTHQATLAHEPTPNLSTNGPPNPNLSDRYTTGVWPFITVPSHIIMGLEDQILRPEIAFDLLNAIPGSGLSQIRCAGHHSYIDKPAEYNEILRRFLKHM